MAVQLPIELIEGILQLLRSELLALKQCALVHTQWLPAVRPHIFSAIDFSKLTADEDSMDQSQQDANPRIGTFSSYVAVIRVGRMKRAQAKRSFNLARTLGTQFDHPKLQLALNKTVFASIPQFVLFLDSFPHLSRVELLGTGAMVSSDLLPLCTTSSLVHLRQMHIGGWSHRLWTHWVSALTMPPRITHLSFTGERSALDQQEISRCILLLASTLEHLEIELYCGKDLSINLSALPHLRTLKVHCPLKFRFSPDYHVKILNGLPHFLATMPASHLLETVHILSYFTYHYNFEHFPQKNDFPKCDWLATDDAFCRGSSVLRIQWDLIFTEDENTFAGDPSVSEKNQKEVLEQLRMKLPKCVARDGLAFESTTKVVCTQECGYSSEEAGDSDDDRGEQSG